MAVAQMGYDGISSHAARARYDSLLAALSFGYPNASKPSYVGAWMDDIKNEVRAGNLEGACWRGVVILF